MTTYDNLSISQATQIQNELREKADISEREFNIATIAGADISLNLYSSTIYAGIIILSFPQLIPLSYSLIKAETNFPYVPGYLAFREVPALVKAWGSLLMKPDVMVIDGHGIAHPRGGELVLVAEDGAWFAYPWFSEKKENNFILAQQAGYKRKIYKEVQLF